MTITTITIGGNNYPAYATVAEADAYLAVDPVRAAAWAALTTDQKGINLVAATRRLDLESYTGEKATEAQTTEWLRVNATCDGEAIPDNVLPQRMEDGTIVLAGSIAIDAAASAAGTGPSNISRVQAGSAEVEFFRPVFGTNFSLAAQNPDVFALIGCFLASAVSAIGYGCASGTDGTSAFTDRDAPGLSEGYP